MDVYSGSSEQAVAGHVVFVGVRVDHRVDGHRGTAAGDNGDRWVDDDRLGRPADEERVARRVAPEVIANEDADMRSELALPRPPVDHPNAHASKASCVAFLGEWRPGTRRGWCEWVRWGGGRG